MAKKRRKPVRGFTQACQLADRKYELFEKHMARAVRAWMEWKEAERVASRAARRKAEREQKEAEWSKEMARREVNRDFAEKVMESVQQFDRTGSLREVK